jgi:hypothetical protein
MPGQETWVGDFLRCVQKGEENVIEIVRKLGPAGKEGTTRLALQNRQLLPEPPRPPTRAESPKRAHSFAEVDGFGAYLRKYGTEDTVILGDLSRPAISAILDETDAYGFEIVTLLPQPSPLLAPWLALMAKPVPVTAFAEAVIANRRSVDEPNARELVSELSQITATETTTLQRGRGNAALNGIIVRTEIQGQTRDEVVELPEIIVIEAPVYLGLPAQRLELDLTLIVHEGEIYARLTCSQLVEANLAAFNSMLEHLRELDEAKAWTIAMGRPGHQDWAYLTEQSRPESDQE